MNLKSSHIIFMGGIFFFTGLILILLSWHYSYPIYMPELNELAFNRGDGNLKFFETGWRICS